MTAIKKKGNVCSVVYYVYAGSKIPSMCTHRVVLSLSFEKLFLCFLCVVFNVVCCLQCTVFTLYNLEDIVYHGEMMLWALILVVKQ
jgi:hypothetical protein